MQDCPKWYIVVRFPASPEDRRGVFEIPAAFFASPVVGETVTLLVEPDDSSLSQTLELLDESTKGKHDQPLTLTFCGRVLRLNREMQAELFASLAAFLVGAELDCEVSTLPFDTLH
jgi:hypothetical protein